MPILLVGAGGFGAEVFDWFREQAESLGSPIIGYLLDPDFQPQAAPLIARELPCFGAIDIENVGDCRLLMAIASPETKVAVTKRFSDPRIFLNIQHHTAVVSRSAFLGCGTLLAPFSLVSASALVGNFVTINVHSSVGHDVKLGDYSTLSSYVDLTGGVSVGDLGFWGSGSRILPGVKVGREVKVGAGAVVYRNTNDRTTLFAPPARKLF